ncbi:hypothetical protein NQ315_004468 [Exocentrus adspersus]|uniref:Raptor N-terminal CASPase-like domain-containing protein n=1 Tax=Exocentrus adspersus TaxID=1586481 RepID=A0AAV8VQ46_9CUCU|nr:hypothetical protein NQ315_004468 [Exocentrus adspersus]
MSESENSVNGDKEMDVKAAITDKDLPLSFTEDRHLEPIQGIDCIAQTWRMKERMKTVSVALVLCLNVGVDPPDVVKTQPCARLECWIDPMQMSSPKALEKIGQTLQTQYERWQPRARYKQSLDPTSEEVKKLCTSLRRNAKEERVLFHYNGHGVPKPTSNGEIWVFNRTYTQYIPLSIFDLQTWMGAPSIYVYDCSNAGIIVDSFKQFAEQHEIEFEQNVSQPKLGVPHSPPSYKNCIQLAACSANQVLPMNPDLPADLFTACLTTPIKVALRWFVLQPTSKLMPKITLDLVDNIPGQISDRRTMLGELNWIFTAITDTIAWNTLPRELFQKLFRQDLLVASLFRNFLLAERILRSCDCTPVSHPSLPPTYQHPMWDAWDLALDLSLGQLPGMLKHNEPFQHLPFFEEQLTAFQVWLELGSEERNPPEQLPIVLQVLLSQIHRMRALELLGRFLDLGPWAVNLALSVGIFPYVLKLLQSCARELRPLLVFIWAKIFSVDNTCQTDLVRDSGHKYFLAVVQDTSVSPEHRTQATFILACIVTNFRDGQEAALQSSLLSVCLEQLSDPYPHLRQWVAICLGRLWDHYEKARWTGVRDIAHEKLYTLLRDPCPEVRAAAIYALGTFINSVTERSEHANNIDHSIVMTLANTVSGDMSSLVRKELINALQWVVLAFEPVFVNLAVKEHNSISSPMQDAVSPGGLRRIASKDVIRITDYDSKDSLKKSVTYDAKDSLKKTSSSSYININYIGNPIMSQSLGTLSSLGYGSVYMKLWNALCSLETDPHPEVAQMCCAVTGYIKAIAKEQRDIVDNRSVSLPPSPKQTACFPSESPPTLHPTADLQKLSRSSVASRSRRIHRSTLNENNDDNVQFCRKPLVNTKFVEWSSKRFAQSHKKDRVVGDPESLHFYERDWRHNRNNNIRVEAVDEQRRALSCKVENQVFHTRTAVPPSLLQLHPFDQQIAVAGNDSFAIWDWGTGAKTTSCHNKSSKMITSKVTAIEWINGHDVAMLMVAADDGSIRLWRPNLGTSRGPSLIAAWQAFSELKPSDKKSAGVVMTWEQWTQTLITSGDTRVIRFWDAEKELKAFDIPTGTDSSVTCIDATFSSMCHENHKKYLNKYGLDDDGLIIDNSDGLTSSYHGPRLGMCAIGCGDGSVRLFDRRCSPSDARVRVWMEHSESVLGIQLRDNLVVSGSAAGDVKIYDIRKNNSIHTTQAVQNHEMSCISIHRSANTFACGSLNQFISIYTLKGTLINTIRCYEGFMSHKIGPVTCLNYHPYKVALATGTLDCCVNVYSLEGRR